jgi:hypothetical protein
MKCTPWLSADRGLTGYRNDLYRFDPANTVWTDLTELAGGATPSPRDFFGFAAYQGVIYIFGGEGYEGEWVELDSLCAASLAQHRESMRSWIFIHC